MEEAWELAAVSGLSRPNVKATINREDGMTVIQFPEYTLKIVDVAVSNDYLTVTLNDGSIMSMPLEWYPRLKNAPQMFRDNWEITGFDQGVSWEDVNEDLQLYGMLAGMGGTRTEVLKWERRDAEGRYRLKDECIVE